MSGEVEEPGLTDESVRSAELGDDGERVDQQSSGKDNIRGGGEFPDPHTPPSDTAPGSAGLVEHRTPGHGQFQDAYDADPERAGSGSIGEERLRDEGD